DIWHVDFTVLVDEVDEPWVRQRLEELASSTAGYDALLREELVSLGSAPSEDFVVTAAIAPAEGEGTGGSDDLPIVFIIAAGAAILCLLGLMIWKGCSRPQPAEEPPYSKTDLPQDDNEMLPPPKLATVVEVMTGPLFRNVPSYHGMVGEWGMGGAKDLFETCLYTPVAASATEAEGHTEEAQAAQAEPPLPPPEVEIPISEVQLSDIQPEVQLADVQPEAAGMRMLRLSTGLDQEGAFFFAVVISSSVLGAGEAAEAQTWGGRIVMMVKMITDMIGSFGCPSQGPCYLYAKEYGQRLDLGGRRPVCETAGSYRETGELTWREVPQSASGLAFECSGHMRSRRRKDMQPEDSFEIVGVFAAYDTSVSALQVGSGRFSIRTHTGLEPTAIGHPASYFAADRV
ncbi:unnamed protein product, partial [Symbiodinium necroappetens]